MSRRWLRSAAFGSLAWLAACAAHAQAAVPQNRPASAQELLAAQPEDLVAELMDERLVLIAQDGKKTAGLVEALVLFEAPPERVWELLLQRERQMEFRPELTGLTIVEQTDAGLLEEQHLKIAFLKVGYRLRDRFDHATRTFTWELDPSFESTLQHVSGYWELHGLPDGRTVARFGTKVSVNDAVPGFLQNGITRKNVPETLENTRQWIDSDGRWRP